MKKNPFYFSAHKNILAVVLCIALFFSFVFLSFNFLSKFQTRKTEAASTNTYPANIEYDGNEPSPYGLYQQSSLANPNIAGVDVILDWSDVEPQQGVFNWTPMDNQIQAWASAGKQYVLVIRYIHEAIEPDCSSGQWIPNWEITRIPTFCSAGGETIPDYFDSTFQSDLQTYISAIAQHLSQSPYLNQIAYIRTGVGMAGEGFACLHCSTSDWQQLNSWGYSTTAWAAWQEQMLSTYKNIWSPIINATLIYPLGNYGTDTSTGQPVATEVAYWGIPRGFGSGQQGLHNDPLYAKGQAVQIGKYIRTNYPNDYFQFQTVKQITGNYSDPISEIQGDMAIASSAGAMSVEWYAADATNSAFQPYFAAWQQQVNTQYGCQSNCVTPTPTPFQILAKDTFQRPNQKFWGTASDGNIWGGAANKNADFSITNNSGQVLNNGTTNVTLNTTLGSSLANTEVLVSGSTTVLNGSNTINLVARWIDANNFYRAFFDGKHVIIAKKVSGTATNLVSIPFTAAANTAYSIRFNLTGTTLSVKIWQTGTQEPAGWTASTTDSSLTSGNVGLRFTEQPGTAITITTFQAIQQ